MGNLLASRYRLTKPLGQGGFGATYLAEDNQMPSNRLCVVKQLCPQVSDPLCLPLIQDRFKREATILESVGKGHTQIPDLYAYFNEEGQFYLVQEWIEGVTLTASIAQRGCWTEAAVENFLIEILPILTYIHSKGVIHRDIKPDNIILRDSDQQPVLIDFGAVRETMGTALDLGNKSTNTIIIGTPGYMPQEQGVGRPVFSSDLYSLGLTAIFLLTGKHPTQLSHDHLTGAVNWRNHVPRVGEGLASILDRAICAHASGRFATAQAMLEALQENKAQTQGLTNDPSKFAFKSTGSSTLVAAPGPATSTNVPSLAAPKGFSDWQKKMLTGSVAGAFALAAIVLMRTPIQEVGSSDLNPVNPDVDQVDMTSAETAIAVGDEEDVPNAASGFSRPPATELSNLAIDNATAPIEPSTPVDRSEVLSEISPALNPDDYSWLSQRYVVESDLRGKTAWQLDVMRNAIFARHGRLFKDGQLQDHFDQQAWYQPIYMPDEFPNNLISPTEEKNAAFILEYQNRNGLRHVP